MRDTASVSLACIDLAGTTLADDGALEAAYAETLAAMGITSGTTAFDNALAAVSLARGRNDIDVLREVFLDEPRARAAELAFQRAYDSVLCRRGLAAVPGAETALDKLAGAGLRICLITTSGSRTLARILDTLDWWKRADLIVCADDVPRGRPAPDAILTAALRCQVDDVRHIAICADTSTALLAGRRAGAATLVGVLTGPHTADALRSAGATHVIPSIAALPDVLLGSS